VKRFTDIFISIIVLLVFFPFGLLIILIIAVVDLGPIFYRQERIGRGGKKFLLWKLRTMRVPQSSEGGQITLGSRDPRITPLGYYLRMLKLDEVPQLFNVIKGEMSLVGPRPEVEKYVRMYNEEQKRILALRPGCTSIAVIRGHFHEAALLDHQQEDPEQYYIKKLMPQKLAHNLYYLDHQSFLLDLRILVGTVLLLLRICKNQPITESIGMPKTDL
jgi:lipopolysaccharide/colanic/teichoic acid biosynthesis glycosyltransferase